MAWGFGVASCSIGCTWCSDLALLWPCCSCSSDLTQSLGTPMCRSCSQKKKKSWRIFPLHFQNLAQKDSNQDSVGVMVQCKWIRLISMRMCVWFLPRLSGLKIWHCRELRCRLQMQLRSGVAVAVAKAGSCSSNSTSSLGIFICYGATLKIKNAHLEVVSCFNYLDLV